MNTDFSNPLNEISALRRAGWIGSVLSLAVLLVDYLELIPREVLSPSFRTLSLVCAFSFLGGFIAALFLNWRGIPARGGVRVGLACGSRAGVIGSVVAAACLLIGNAAAMRGNGFSATADFFPLLSACMSIVPGIAFGLLGGLFATLLRSPASFARDIPILPTGSTETTRFMAHVPGMLLTLLAVAAFLSPFFPCGFEGIQRPHQSYPRAS